MGTVHAKDVRVDTSSINAPYKEKKPKEIEISGVPARVDRVTIQGLGRTKDDIVEASIKELFKATNFQDVILKAHSVRGRLDSLGCFKSIGIFIDTSKGPGATPAGLEITFHVQELKRIVGGVNTMVGNNEGSLVVSVCPNIHPKPASVDGIPNAVFQASLGLKLPNVVGRGERVQAEYSYGNQKTSNINVAFIKPFVRCKNDPPTLTLSAFQQASEWPWSGYSTIDRGALLDLAFNSVSFIKHNLQLESTIRELYTLTKTSSFDVREQAGPKLKVALRHILSVDKRDDKVFPTRGGLFQMTTEVAGPGGNVGHVKNDFHLQMNRQLGMGVVMQGTVQFGILTPWLTYGSPDLSENYYLGGPLSVRGFNMRGIGPQSSGNFVGAHMFWAAGAQVFSPLPFRPGQGGFGDLFRVHGFVNFGNVGKFDISPDIEKSWASMSDAVRISSGLGLAMRIGHIARIELNYCFPIQAVSTDSICPGIQFGIGLKFL